MHSGCMTKRIGRGVVAGLAGTAVIQGAQALVQKTMPSQMPPMRQHPGEYMVDKAEGLLPPRLREKVPQVVERGAAQLAGVAYGLAFGVGYTLLPGRKGGVVAGGTALGLVTWAAGYLGWLPATGLMPPVTRQRPGQVMGGILSHVAYGVVTAWTGSLLRKRGWWHR